MKGTDLEPQISGHAKIGGKAARLVMDVDRDHVERPTAKFGGQYLTYVLRRDYAPKRKLRGRRCGKESKQALSLERSLEIPPRE